MRLGDLCQREPVTCTPQASAADVAVLMREHHVGDLVVVDAAKRPVGIVTDRDLVLRVIAARIDPDSVTAGDLMSEVATASESDLVHDAIWGMRRKGFRRLPVVGAEGVLRGLVTADDLAGYLAEALTELARVSPQQRRREQERLGR